MRRDRLKHIGHADAVLRRNRHRLAETERIGFHVSRVARPALRLVSDEHDGLARLADNRGEMLVVGNDARAGINHEEDEVGGSDRRLRLLAHPLGERARLGRLQARGVDGVEGQIPEFRLALAPVAGDAR
jgi:hypothetical protein